MDEIEQMVLQSIKRNNGRSPQSDYVLVSRVDLKIGRHRDPWRAVDRATQKLRKKGIIKFEKGRWHVV